MIKSAMTVLMKDLNAFLEAETTLVAPISLDNVATNASEVVSTSSIGQILLTLVGLEEETVLKNTKAPNASLSAGDMVLPPMRINLYVLFSFKSDDYGQALQLLSKVMGFCQAKKVWNQNNTPFTVFSGSTLEYQDFQFALDIHNISFEDSNNMWGNLGGKQLPFVIYKMRLVTLSESLVHNTSGLITNTITNSNGL